jgi:hypothetical protein
MAIAVRPIARCVKQRERWAVDNISSPTADLPALMLDSDPGKCGSISYTLRARPAMGQTVPTG